MGPHHSCAPAELVVHEQSEGSVAVVERSEAVRLADEPVDVARLATCFRYGVTDGKDRLQNYAGLRPD